MKKILALVLACVMLASMFTVNAFAVEHVVGGIDSSSNRTPADPSWTNSTSAPGNVNVTVTAVTHNYCVDLLYTDTSVTLPGITWDVQDMKYNVNETEKANFEDNNKKKFTVTNYSDLSVKVVFDVHDSNLNDAINCSIADGTVDAVVNLGSGTGEAVAKDFVLTITCDNYVTAAKAYAENGTAANVTVATYTVTISK